MFKKAIVLVVTVIFCTGGYGLVHPNMGYATPEYTCEFEIANDRASEPCVFMTPKWQGNSTIIYGNDEINAEKYTSDCNGKRILEKVISDVNTCQVIGGDNPVQMILFSPDPQVLGDGLRNALSLEEEQIDVMYESIKKYCDNGELHAFTDKEWYVCDMIKTVDGRQKLLSIQMKALDNTIKQWKETSIDFNAKEIQTLGEDGKPRTIYIVGYPTYMYGECIGYDCESNKYVYDYYYDDEDWIDIFTKFPYYEWHEKDYPFESFGVVENPWLSNYRFSIALGKRMIYYGVEEEKECLPEALTPHMKYAEFNTESGFSPETSCSYDNTTSDFKKTLTISQNINIKGGGTVVFRGVELDFIPGKGSITIWGDTIFACVDCIFKNPNFIIKNREIHQGEAIYWGIDLIFADKAPLHLIHTKVVNTKKDEVSGVEEAIGHELKLEIDGQYEMKKAWPGWLVMSDFESYDNPWDLKPTSADIKLNLADTVKCELINGAYCRLPTGLNVDAYYLVNTGTTAGKLAYLGNSKDKKDLCFRAQVWDDGEVNYGNEYCDGLVADMKGLKLYNGGYYDGYFLSGYTPEKQKVPRDGKWVDGDEYVNSHYYDGYFLVYDKTDKKFKKLEFSYPELKKNPWEETCWNDKASEIDVCCTDPMMEKTDAKELVATDNVCRCKDGYNQVEKAGSYDVLGTVSKWCNPTEAVVTEIAEGLTGERIVRYEPGNGFAQIWYDDCGKGRVAKEGHKECIPCPPDMYEPEDLPGVCITLTKLCGPDDAYDANKCKPCGDDNDFYVPEDDKTLGCKLCEWDEKVDFSVQKCVKLECGASAVIVDHQCVPCATGMVVVNNECVPAPDEEEEPGLGGGDDEAEPGEGYGSGGDAAAEDATGGDQMPSGGDPAGDGASPGDDNFAEKENSPESGDGASGPYKSAMGSKGGKAQKFGMAVGGTAMQKAPPGASADAGAKANAFGCSVAADNGSLSTVILFLLLVLGLRIARRKI